MRKTWEFSFSVLKLFNYAIDVFILYILLFGHMSGSIFGKAFEMDGLFVGLLK